MTETERPGRCLQRAFRAGRAGRRALLPDLRLPRRRPAAARDGPGRSDDVVGPRAVPDAGRARLLRHPLRQPRHRPVDQGARPDHAGDAGPRVRRPAGARAVRPARPGRATPSRCSTTSVSRRRTWSGSRWAAWSRRRSRSSTRSACCR